MPEKKDVIFLIEDSATIRNNITELLKDNFTIHPFETGESALQKLNEIIPDLILLDIVLAGSTDGLSVLKIIKQDQKLMHIPVIMMSSLDSETTISKGLELGANDYLCKPFKMYQLEYKIKNQLFVTKRIKDIATISANIPFSVDDASTSVLKQFELLIEECIANIEDMNIKDFSKKLNISVSSLERIIKKNFNTTPNRYILQRRLEKAQILLQSKKDISIKEVSLSLGFSSVSYFTKCFREFYGHTPSSTHL